MGSDSLMNLSLNKSLDRSSKLIVESRSDSLLEQRNNFLLCLGGYRRM